jgi:DNA (cytosine-5-)-methyltransferase
MKIIDLFSGIGGFSLGFQRAGYQFTEHYFSEIDKHAIANYKHNFPHAKNLGDITTLHGREFTDIDIITFGSPCQNFSTAGRREGLKGAKSSLIQHAIALITDIRPSLFVWENVKGAFSSNAGADFWAILQAFAHIGGYRLEWQLLNTSWLLPQNRERIYLIGHFAGRSVPGVFPIGKDDKLLEGKTRKENRKRTSIKTSLARTITARYSKMGSNDTYIVPKVAATLTGGGHSGGLHSDMTVIRHKRGRNKGVRRLTEIECERLQGFPDNWTQYGNYDGVIKPIAKTQRYMLIGNAVTVDIVELIAKRLKFIVDENIPIRTDKWDGAKLYP